MITYRTTQGHTFTAADVRAWLALFGPVASRGAVARADLDAYASNLDGAASVATKM